MDKNTEINKKFLTLCIIHRPPNVLLGMKKRGFGAGRWNGFGGKVSANESIEEAARREMREEAGIEVGKLDKAGIIEFGFEGDPEILEVHVFKATDFYGEPSESEEMKPKWFNADEIPYAEMWPDDEHWLPLFLNGKKFRGKFIFEGSDTILDSELIEVQEL